MEFSQTMAARYSCRSFLEKPVDEATIKSLVETAQHSPSWGNTQPWRVWGAGGQVARSIRERLVEQASAGQPSNPEFPMPQDFSAVMKKRYGELGKSLFALLGIGRGDDAKRAEHNLRNFDAFGAPALIFVTVPADQTSYAVLDAGMFVHAFCLAAVDRGLVTCIEAQLARYPDTVRQHLPIPADGKILVGIALGYADTSAVINSFRTTREPLEAILNLTGF